MSLTVTNRNQPIDELYPYHAKALKVADLNPRKYLALKEAHKEIRKAERAKATRRVNPYDSQEVIEKKKQSS